MYPTLLSLGEDLQFHSYTVMIALAFLVGVILACRANDRSPTPQPVTPIGGIWIFFFSVLGAKIYYILQYKTIWDLGEVVYFWGGGLVFFGGLIGGLVGALLYMRFVRASALYLTDVVVPYVPLAHAIARFGCLLNGCCFGGPCELPWAIAFPKDSAAYMRHIQDGLITMEAEHSLHVHPTQIYASVGLIFIFLIMRYAYKRPHGTGSVALLYPILYGALRFSTEFTRGDSARSIFDLTVSQAFALSLCVGGLVVYGALWQLVWSKGAETAETVESAAAESGDGASETPSD